MPPQNEDIGAPSETFSGLTPESTDVPRTSLWNMLSEALREDDTASGLILQRLLSRPEQLRDAFAQKAWKLVSLSRVDLVPSEIVDELLVIVGFGRGSGTAYSVARVLTDNLKRRLIKGAVAFWKAKGTLPGLEDSLTFVTGARPLIDRWDDFKWEEGDEIPYLPTLASISSIELPYEVGDEPDADDLGEYESRIYVTSIGDSVIDQLVYDLCSLARPANEAYEIHYCLYADRFLDGKKSHWQLLDGDPSTYVEAQQGSQPLPQRLPGLQFPTGTTREALIFDVSGTWTNYSVRLWLRPGLDLTRVLTIFLFSDADSAEESGVGVVLDFNTSIIQAVSRAVGDGADTLGALTPTFEYAEDPQTTFWLEVDVEVIDATYANVRAIWNGDVILEEDVPHLGQTQGPLEIRSADDYTWDLCRIEIEPLARNVRRLYPPAYQAGLGA